MLISRLRYYTRSLPTILAGMGDRRALLRALLGRPAAGFYEIELAKLGIRFKVQTRLDIWVIKEVCLDGAYALESLLPYENPVFIDIGACFGAFAIQAARAFPSGKVLAYEPFPDSIALLEENIKLNQLVNVDAFACAVSGSPGEERLYLDPREAVRNSTVPPMGVNFPHALDVASTSLDEIFAEHNIEKCDLLKMDCEGAEYEILFGASESTLRRVRRIALEYHDWVDPYEHRDLVCMLKERGFEVRVQANSAYPGIGFLEARECRSAEFEQEPYARFPATHPTTGLRISSSGRMSS